MIYDCPYCNNFSACGINEYVQAGWTPKAERFTGFDGIPDWDDKDFQIDRLKKQIAAFESERKSLFSNIETLQATVRELRRVIDEVQSRVKESIRNAELDIHSGHYFVQLWVVIRALRQLVVEGL